MHFSSAEMREVYRRTLTDVGVSAFGSALLAYAAYVFLFGDDPKAIIGSVYAALCMGTAGIIASGLIGGALSLRGNLARLRLLQLQAELARIATHDPLTNLLNRRGFDKAAADALAKTKPLSVSAVALMLDIDRFKAINDRLGHEFGDAVLCAVAGVLCSFITQTRVVGRHGGEEFALLFVNESLADVCTAAEQLREACANTAITSCGSQTSVTVSIGISIVEHDLAGAFRRADAALYDAKRKGRNRVAVFGEETPVVNAKSATLTFENALI